GSANNQCLRAEHGDVLRQCGIVYAPDFVINAGGLLNVAMELAPTGYDEARVLAQVHHIADTVRALLDTAARQDISTHCAAMQLAEQKLGMARQAHTADTAGWDAPATVSVGPLSVP